MGADEQPFKAAKGDEVGDNWLICFGNDGMDDWYVTTEDVYASELSEVSGGAQVDAKTVAKLLNDHYLRPDENLSSYVERRLRAVFEDVAGIVSAMDLGMFGEAVAGAPMELFVKEQALVARWKELMDA